MQFFTLCYSVVHSYSSNKENTSGRLRNSNACQMLASIENKLRFNGFSSTKKKNKISLRKNKDAIHHNNHWEGLCLPTKASVTTAAPETLYSVRVTGTQPHYPPVLSPNHEMLHCISLCQWQIIKESWYMFKNNSIYLLALVFFMVWLFYN